MWPDDGGAPSVWVELEDGGGELVGGGDVSIGWTGGEDVEVAPKAPVVESAGGEELSTD